MCNGGAAAYLTGNHHVGQVQLTTALLLFVHPWVHPDLTTSKSSHRFTAGHENMLQLCCILYQDIAIVSTATIQYAITRASSQDANCTHSVQGLYEQHAHLSSSIQSENVITINHDARYFCCSSEHDAAAIQYTGTPSYIYIITILQ